MTTHPLALLAALLVAAATAPEPDAGPVSFEGKVVDAETGASLAGAEVVVKLSLNNVPLADEPEWAKPKNLTADASGRFAVEFPPERPGEAVYLNFPEVRHEGYATISFSNVISRVSLLKARRCGDLPYFHTVALHKGREYSGRLVYPNGDPAPHVAFNLTGGNWEYPEHGRLRYVTDGETDDSGRFAIWLPPSQHLRLWASPPSGRFVVENWNQNFRGEALASGDLGVVRVPPGWRIPGRMIDREGRPLAGQTVTLYDVAQSGLSAEAVTDADGRFSFPMPSNPNATIHGQGHPLTFTASGFGRPARAGSRVVAPVSANESYPAGSPKPVVLRELPTFAVTVRFVDSEGKPAPGSPVTLSGTIPTPATDPDVLVQTAIQSLGQPQAAGFPAGGVALNRVLPAPRRLLFNAFVGNPQAANLPSHLQWHGGQPWSFTDTPGPDGTIVFRAPAPLINAELTAANPNEETSYLLRRTSDASSGSSFMGLALNTVDADVPDVEIVVRRAPTVLVEVRSETGDPLLPENVSAVTTTERGQYQANVARQADGRYRGQSLAPDYGYEWTAWLNGYIQNAPAVTALEPGEERILTLVLRPRPTPPKAGDLAPPYVLRTNDGRIVSPDTTKGKFVLIHTWDRQSGGLPNPGAKVFEDVHRKFAKDGRVLVVGIRVDHPTALPVRVNRNPRFRTVTPSAVEEDLPYPWAKLRQGYSEPFLVDFGLGQNQVVLIGPDGKIVQRDLIYAQVPQIVDDAVGRK